MNRHKKWNLQEERQGSAAIWVESILGGIAIALMFAAIMILSAALV